MRNGRLRNVALVFAFCLAGRAAGEPPATAPRPYEDVVRLHRAGLSEDFILRKIGRDGVVYVLSTDDIIACKAAGLPESIIEAMLTKAGGPPSAAAPPPATVVVAPTPTPTPTPVEAPAAPSDLVEAPAPVPTPAVVAPAPGPVRSWEGMARRSPGVVLFRNRWEEGTLSFREGSLHWLDRSDGSKSVVLPVSEIREHFLVCPRESEPDAACFEWGVKTATGELRFRDAAWQRAAGTKPREVFDFVQAAWPGLPTGRYRLSKR